MSGEDGRITAIILACRSSEATSHRAAAAQVVPAEEARGRIDHSNCAVIGRDNKEIGWMPK